VNLRPSSFAAPSLEREYQAELVNEKIRLTRTMVLLATPINLAFLGLDFWAVPSALQEVWALRGVIAAAFVGLLATTWLPSFSRWYAPATAVSVLVTGLCVNAMIFLARPDELAAQVYYGGLILLIMAAHTMTYLTVSVAAAISVVFTLTYVGVALSHRWPGGGLSVQVVAHLFFFVATAVIGAVAQSLRDRYSRENYLLRHSLQRDVELKEEESRRASFLAEHDPLTGLANRLKLERQLSRMLDQARDAQRLVALMFLDLDGFKPVNDIHGHAVGDRVLRVLADRLRGCVAGDDVVARVGGDEFVVGVVVDGPDQHAIARVACRIAAAVEEGIELRGGLLRLSACVGVAAYPADGQDLETLLRCADEQMYRVKRSGKGGVSLSAGCSRPALAG
jgi:diguanylate cyclase (GGDEF)-like protein